jgi:pimeloyl-ACP methyl ester carboxylesterase
VIVLLAFAALIAAGVLYQAVGSYRDARRNRAPGRLVEAGGVCLHFDEQGTAGPAVVLESGIAATSLSWALVQPKLAAFSRVCSYDRAGLGWSAECSTPRTVEGMISELEAMLSRAALPAPYILVGHSFGGLLVRAYAYLKPGQVSGLVLVDPVSLEYWGDCHSDEQHRLDLGAKLSRRGALLARFGIVRFALAALASGGRRFPKLIARASARQGTKAMQSLLGEVQKLPRRVWPLVRAHWSRPKCFRALALYLECLPENARAALSMPIPRYIPVTVLSASSATEFELRERDSWVGQSARGRHIRVAECGHWVQLEKPDVVVKAVCEMIETVFQKKTPQQLAAAEGSESCV